MFCHNCGSQLPDDAKFCGNCGAVQLPSGPAPAPIPEPVYTPPPAPEPELSIPAAELDYPAFEPGEPAPKPAPEPVAVPVQFPAGTFTWEHVTISGEFNGGKGTITIHFE